MNILARFLTLVVSDRANGNAHGLVRKLYFAISYNTTFPVNVMYALGSMSPYILVLMGQGQLTARRLGTAVILTLYSAYLYNLVYVVNDYIDRDKDERLGIPKQTAKHILGRDYLWYFALVHIVTVAGVTMVWPRLLMTALTYSFVLVVLSALHSYARRAKLITIFIERFMKFCSPFLFIYIASDKLDVKLMLVGALLAYPFGFMFDYAYRGYLRDRVKVPTQLRFILYGAYWSLLAGIFVFDKDLDALMSGYQLIIQYLLAYFGVAVLANGLSRKLSYGFLDNLYSTHVASEKRRLLTYGILQIAILVLGACYVVAN